MGSITTKFRCLFFDFEGGEGSNVALGDLSSVERTNLLVKRTQTLKSTVTTLEQRCNYLSHRSAILKLELVNLSPQKNDAIVRATIKRKIAERRTICDSIEKTEGLITVLIQTRYAVEQANLNNEVFRVLDSQKRLLQQLKKQCDSDKVETLMEDLSEMLQDTNQVSEFLSHGDSYLGDKSGVSDEELERELEGLTELVAREGGAKEEEREKEKDKKINIWFEAKREWPSPSASDPSDSKETSESTTVDHSSAKQKGKVSKRFKHKLRTEVVAEF